jgi:formamidopyrimidine-DNA glycosylase
MPELPEVETVARGLRFLAGQRLREIEIYDDRVWFESEAEPDHLKGRLLKEISRRGKYILLRFENKITIAQHLRMTGKMLEAGSRLVPAKVSEAVKSRKGKGLQVRCSFRFEGADIWFFDTRRFGTLTLVLDEEKFFREKRIAPDPIHDPDFAYQWFVGNLAKTSKPIKSALLVQGIVAGVGNIYADEALFASRIHPRTKASQIHETQKLWENILRILHESIRQGGSTIRDYVSAEGKAGAFAASHDVYDHKGDPCRVCDTIIEKVTLGGRSTHYCPNCQKAPSALGLKGGQKSLRKAPLREERKKALRQGRAREHKRRLRAGPEEAKSRSACARRARGRPRGRALRGLPGSAPNRAGDINRGR